MCGECWGHAGMASPCLGCRDSNLEMSCGGFAVWWEEEEMQLLAARPGARPGRRYPPPHIRRCIAF